MPASLRLVRLGAPDEIYFRYYVEFDPSWELASDGEIGKLPGFGGTYGIAGWGGRPADGTNGWSARMMNFDTGSGNAAGFYTYHADMMGHRLDRSSDRHRPNLPHRHPR
jgi:hypothetical protein